MKRRAVLAGLALIAGAIPAMADDQAFLAAARDNDAAALTHLLAAGQSVDVRESGGRTALLLATHANAVEAARVLIEAGADVNAKDDIKDTPYLYAGAEGRTEILKLLLAAGADLRDTNRFGGTALIPAAEKGHPENVRLLLAAGVDPNHVNGLGWTALLEAVILTDGGPVYQEIVADLIKGGADVILADADGVTPLAHARARGYAEIGNLLEAAGVK
jgi:ankyrin repeat protein